MKYIHTLYNTIRNTDGAILLSALHLSLDIFGAIGLIDWFLGTVSWYITPVSVVVVSAVVWCIYRIKLFIKYRRQHVVTIA